MGRFDVTFSFKTVDELSRFLAGRAEPRWRAQAGIPVESAPRPRRAANRRAVRGLNSFDLARQFVARCRHSFWTSQIQSYVRFHGGNSSSVGVFLNREVKKGKLVRLNRARYVRAAA